MVSEYGSGGPDFDLGPQPEYVYIVDVTKPQCYMSVHATEAGARRRITDLASEWGVPLEQLESNVVEKVIESP
jgi:hypothetical protein